MKFKVGDKVKATDDYMVEHAKAIKYLWNAVYQNNDQYSNMTVTDIIEHETFTFVCTTHTSIPWMENDLELLP